MNAGTILQKKDSTNMKGVNKNVLEGETKYEIDMILSNIKNIYNGRCGFF